MMTKIKLSNCPHEGGGCKSEADKVTIDPRYIIAWIEHHNLIGFEHFYIFDKNAEKPHGTLEHILMPYIDSGLVTYIWYPLEDCIVNYPTQDKQIGDHFTDSQAAATTAALRRYQHLTTYMAHFDVDEYIVPPTGITDFRDVVRQYEQFDSLTLQLTWFSSCKGEEVGTSSTLLPFDSYHCFNTDVTPWKSIMKTSRILAFFVHVPVANVQGMVAGNSKHFDNILVAHYQVGVLEIPMSLYSQTNPMPWRCTVSVYTNEWTPLSKS